MRNKKKEISLRKEIENYILTSCNLEDKIRLCRIYESVVNASIERIYDAISIENHVSELFFDFLLDRLNNIPDDHLQTNDIIHVITEPYLTGGHTRLCEKLASTEVGVKSLLITGVAEPKVIKRLNVFFDNVEQVFYQDFFEHVFEIYKKLLSYKKIVLHIHPSDILTVIAVSLLRTKYENFKVFFVNHSDHTFSYGRSVSDYVLQISYRGYEIDQYVKDKPYESTFIGIPVTIPNDVPNFKKGENIVIAGASYKMRPTKNINLQKQLYNFMKGNNLKLFVVGVNLTNYWWWKLKISFPRRVSFFNLLPYDEYKSILKNSHICIDTAPITGGTAFCEMFCQSLYPIALKSGIYGYTPLDLIRVDNISTPVQLNSDTVDSLYNLVKEVHDISNVGKRYSDVLKGEISPLPSSLTLFENDLDLFYCNGMVKVSKQLLYDLLNVKSIGFLFKLRFLITKISFSESILYKVLNKL